jgi:hypothetical protein
VIDTEAIAKIMACNNIINTSREKKMMEWPDTSPPVAN